MLTHEEIEQLQARVAALEARLDEVPFRVKSLRIDNPDPHPAIFVHQAGVSTAIVCVQDSDNPAVNLMANGNAAALEIAQADGEDAIVALGADIRCEQFIAVGESPHFCMAPHGTIQWAGEEDESEYWDAIQMTVEGIVFTGV